MAFMNRIYRVGNGTLGRFGLTALTALGGVWLPLVDDEAGTGVILVVIGGVTAILGLLLAWLLRAATLVDSRGITIRGLFGVKHLPWRDIQELSVEQYRGSPRRVPAARRRRCTCTTGRPPDISFRISTPRAWAGTSHWRLNGGGRPGRSDGARTGVRPTRWPRTSPSVNGSVSAMDLGTMSPTSCPPSSGTRCGDCGPCERARHDWNPKPQVRRLDRDSRQNRPRRTNPGRRRSPLPAA
jgi:hypothetical protein